MRWQRFWRASTPTTMSRCKLRRHDLHGEVFFLLSLYWKPRTCPVSLRTPIFKKSRCNTVQGFILYNSIGLTREEEEGAPLPALLGKFRMRMKTKPYRKYTVTVTRWFNGPVSRSGCHRSSCCYSCEKKKRKEQAERQAALKHEPVKNLSGILTKAIRPH